MTRMTPDHRGITSHLHLPSSLIASRADSLDDYSADCGLLRLSASSSSAKQQQLGDLSDACSTVSSTDTVVEAAASSSFDFDLDLLDDCQVPSLELPFPELDSKKEIDSACREFCAYEETLSSCCGLSPQQVSDYLWLIHASY